MPVPFSSALLSRKDADHGQHLLAELQNVFDRQVIWVSEDSKEVSVGVSPSSESPISRDGLCRHSSDVGRDEAERVRIVEGDRYDQCNCRTSNRQWELAQGSAVDPVIFVWAYPLADGSIAIDLSGWKAGPDKVSISSSNVLKPGQLSTIREYTKDGMEYRVFQATELLKNDGSGLNGNGDH